MQCRRCGKEIGNYIRCSFCGYENFEGNVREMTNSEKNFYDGVTIDTGETADETAEKNSANSNPNCYRQKTNYKPNYNYSRRTFYTSSSSSIFSQLLGKLITGLMNNELLAKIAVTLIAVAISALMFFVALPILFLILAIGIALFVISKFGR